MHRRASINDSRGFTLPDLLVVVAVLGLLLLMLAPVFADSRSSTKTTQCLNNLRRLTGAWHMYTSDNADLLPVRIASGNMAWTALVDCTNTAILIDRASSPLASYNQSVDIFKCPADNYDNPVLKAPRARSLSGNALLGNGIQPGNVFNQIPGRTYIRAFSKLTQLNKPGPESTICILEEHPDSIDDALFITRVGETLASAYWVNLPGSNHDGAGTISFVDGHAVLKRWLDRRTAPPVVYIPQNNFSAPVSPDYEWLNERMPYQ